MAQAVYPLLQVLDVKRRRVEDQERVVLEKKKALEQEQEKLRQREEEKNKAQKHADDKLFQLREELDHGTTTDKIIQMKAYLKVAKEKVKVEEKKVKDQKEQVEIAEKNLLMAEDDLKKRRQEVDKLVIHQKDWTREMKKEMEIIEERESDDLGSTIFLNNLIKKKNM